MNNFKIIPLEKSYANKIRISKKDAFGNAVIKQVATGLGPCRVSLKAFRVGVDRRLLLKHSPFAIENIYNQSGPIFISADEVEEYSDIHKFPPEIKNDRINFPLTLIAYDEQQRMIFTKLVGSDDVDDLLNSIFATQPKIEFIHVRNAEAACYICKVERI